MAMAGSLTMQRGHGVKGLALVACLPFESSLPSSRDLGRTGMKILLVDDHQVVRTGLRGLLTSVGITEIAEAANGHDALLRLQQDRPDLVLLDLNLPGIGGLELLRRMLREDKAARILVLSMHAEPLFVPRAIELGACGYLSKNVSSDELLTAVRITAEGGRYIENELAQELALRATSSACGLQNLTERELEIMRLLAKGMGLTEIADTLGIRYKTVANTCSRIKAKLGVTRTNDLVRLVLTLGIA
jgi:two-component system, NarL family, invasion response regulator UvrY